MVKHHNAGECTHPQLACLEDIIAVPQIPVQLLLRPVRLESYHTMFLGIDEIQVAQPPPAVLSAAVIPILAHINLLFQES